MSESVVIYRVSINHIRFIYDDFFFDNDLFAYRFVGSCDALLTDYSSIYFDFMLVNKPIGLIWEDVEDYKRMPGFAKGVEKLMCAGEKIYTLDELKAFISNLVNSVDNLKQERERICKMVHCSNDGKNSARVVDFIIEKAKL